jgi:hypothetical protein
MTKTLAMAEEDMERRGERGKMRLRVSDDKDQ